MCLTGITASSTKHGRSKSSCVASNTYWRPSSRNRRGAAGLGPGLHNKPSPLGRRGDASPRPSLRQALTGERPVPRHTRPNYHGVMGHLMPGFMGWWLHIGHERNSTRWVGNAAAGGLDSSGTPVGCAAQTFLRRQCQCWLT